MQYQYLQMVVLCTTFFSFTWIVKGLHKCTISNLHLIKYNICKLPRIRHYHFQSVFEVSKYKVSVDHFLFLNINHRNVGFHNMELWAHNGLFNVSFQYLSLPHKPSHLVLFLLLGLNSSTFNDIQITSSGLQSVEKTS